MSLSSLLLASKAKTIDTELDALFKSNPAPPRTISTASQAPAAGSAPPAKKRKIEAAISDPPERKKKRKSEELANPPKASPKTVKSAAKPLKPAKKSKRAEPVVEVEEEEDSDGSDEDDEDNSDLENAYLGKMRSNKPSAPAATNSDDEDEVEDEDEGEANDSDSEESDPDAPPPVHESLTKRVRMKPAKKSKIVPESETPAQRDARTLFIGGLPLEVAQKKPLKKQLSRHILSFLPSSSKVKIESIRFRSVAFRDPTSSTALSSSTSAPTPRRKRQLHPGPGRLKSLESARLDLASRGGGGGEEKKPGRSRRRLKKRVPHAGAEEKNPLHPGRVPPRGEQRNCLRRPRTPRSDADDDADSPYAVAQHIARAANASEFMARTLRVDVCARLPDADPSTGGADGAGFVGDPKLSIFIGNLDFGSREGDVREFFEGVVAGERGPAPPASPEDGASTSGGGRWVQGVRLIRDRETQLGKGFGYVRFVDRECVDEILALAKTDEGKKKLKFAKRTLRVQRCKAASASAPSNTTKAADAKSTPSKSKSTYPASPPKRGDPTLGARLAHLDKDARKAAKKADPDRLLRRAEKKKMGMRTRMATDKVKAGGGKRVGGHGGSRDKGTGKGKERERERKTRVHKNAGGPKGRK
ncbi:RRM domain-containing protein [Mycena venus]|uniref:Nucleolar protein 12 n=1 Tax=Mycena venus TaxID=2733690 RepID=A0A8H7D4Z8_9AGAR|nr:RRM domain-containing protein [Mycena venus]